MIAVQNADLRLFAHKCGSFAALYRNVLLVRAFRVAHRYVSPARRPVNLGDCRSLERNRALAVVLTRRLNGKIFGGKCVFLGVVLPRL